MKIGIDLDEVIVEFVKSFIDFYNQKYSKKISFQDVKSYNFWEEGMGKDREEAIRLVDEFYKTEKFENMPFVDGAFEGLRTLASRNQIYIITSRPERFKKKTNMFIEKYFSDVPLEIIYSGDFHKSNGHSKADICEKLGIPVIIEDNLEYSLECLEMGIRAILLDKPWNQRESERNGRILRVKNWKEILKAI